MKKDFYEAPELEVLDVRVEQGFATSTSGGNDSMDIEPGFGE